MSIRRRFLKSEFRTAAGNAGTGTSKSIDSGNLNKYDENDSSGKVGGVSCCGGDIDLGRFRLGSVL